MEPDSDNSQFQGEVSPSQPIFIFKRWMDNSDWLWLYICLTHGPMATGGQRMDYKKQIRALSWGSVNVGCEVLPKVGSGQDSFVWRLSFSQAERILSCHVGNKARKAYVEVKIFIKKHMNKQCPFLKTWHLKTIFFHHMESTSEEYRQETDLLNTISDLLKTLSSRLKI